MAVPRNSHLTLHYLTQEHINDGMNMLLLHVLSFGINTVFVKPFDLEQIIKSYLFLKPAKVYFMC